MEDSFGYLAFTFFAIVAIVEGLYRAADKRTGWGSRLRVILHAIGLILFIVIAIAFCFAE